MSANICYELSRLEKDYITLRKYLAKNVFGKHERQRRLTTFVSMPPSEDHEDTGAVDVRAHKRLLDAVSRLHKTQFIKKPTRNEPAIKRSEFHLVKTNTFGDAEESRTNQGAREATISMPDLVKVLNKTSKHLSIGKELRSNERNKKVLDKPLERPVADRIKRSIGYDKAKKKLNRWNAVVTRNRVTDHMSFPLNQDDRSVEIVDSKPKSLLDDLRIKSDLMVAMAKLEPKTEVVVMETPVNEADHELTLTREEMIARSKELRLLRIRESQKGAKARMQNKIKSKKFHKIMKKEKLKEQMKEFEQLQKQDPEAALKKLEQLEKQRVEERALLRHKNTGTWAKNLQVRAKYDKDVRKELTQQLSISRELTQKQRDPDDDEDNEDEEALQAAVARQEAASDPFNPWMKKGVSAATLEADSLGGYRKYWNERNENVEALRKYRAADDVPVEAIRPKQTRIPKPKAVKGWTVEECEPDEILTPPRNIRKSSNTDTLDDLFDNAEDSVRSKVADRFKEFTVSMDETSEALNRRGVKRSSGKLSGDLSFKQQAKRPAIDEALDIGSDDDDEAGLRAIEQLKNISTANVATADAVANINPDKFMKVIPKHLRTALPDTEGDFDESNDEAGRADAKRLTIAEAFEDDDIVADFAQERDDERRKNEPEDINLTLPGWGSWAGSGISKHKKAKKLILKFPKVEPRNEENQGHVIIVDAQNKKLREHQVSHLPFPFTSVKDYEASIRAPIGRDFVPALAHQLLTKPAITTKLGAIIEPMTNEILVKRPVAPVSKTEMRVAKLQAKAEQRNKKTSNNR